VSEFDRFARYYDADYATFDADIPFYRELARRTGGPIVELMCGTGRVLLPLAQAGYQASGVDISQALLDRAQAKLTHAGAAERVSLVAADVRENILQGPFALAIVALNSFMHLTTTVDQLRVLQHAHSALAPDGLLVLDLFNPDLRELARLNGELVLDKTFALEDGAPVQKFVSQFADAATQTTEVTFIYDELTAEGHVRRSVAPFAMRWLYRYELEHLLVRAGFALEAVYGSYDLDDYDSSSALMLTVARKGR
jgi:SAM-dependent methyltransferase